MMDCPGCRYCEWLPRVTRQLHGCPARDVTVAVVQAVQSARKRKRRREGEQRSDTCTEEEAARAASGGTCRAVANFRVGSGRGDDDAGCGVFCDEYSQSVRGVDAALLCKAGGVHCVLHCMWDSLPTQRRAKYKAFALQHGITGTMSDTKARNVASSLPPAKRSLEYWSASENWEVLEPHFKSTEARALWLPAMCQLWLERRCSGKSDRETSTTSIVAELLRLPGTPKHEADLLPSHLEAIDWRQTARTQLAQASEDSNEAPCRQFAEPPFWGWVCGGACHSLAPLYAWIAQRVEPTVAWRIITSDAHSTVWDGNRRLFDPIFEAMGVEATEAFRRAGGGEAC